MSALGQHRARKRFGQNFLTDRGVIASIVRAIAPQPGDRLVEIGPGLAALTQPLVERVGRLTVIELDRDLAQRLRLHPQLDVVQADVLTVDFAQLASIGGQRLRVVGNLPYNISSPILFHLLPFASEVIDQHFMLQKEVVDRMVAAPDHADYGRLSVMLQWRYAMETVLHVPPESFEPAPRVDSAVVRMRPHTEPVALNPRVLEDVLRAAFSQRRKLLRHSLGPWLAERVRQQPLAIGSGGIDFDLQRRAQEVPVDEYLALVKRLGP